MCDFPCKRPFAIFVEVMLPEQIYFIRPQEALFEPNRVVWAIKRENRLCDSTCGRYQNKKIKLSPKSINSTDILSDP